MVVQFVLAWRRGKRELIPDPPPKPVEEIKNEAESTENADDEIKKEAESTEKESDTPQADGEEKPSENGETEVKTEEEEIETNGSDGTKVESEEKQDETESPKDVDDDDEKKTDEVSAESEPVEKIETEEAEKVEKAEISEKAEEDKTTEEQEPMETEESTSKPETEETKMDVDDAVASTEPKEDAAKPETEEEEDSTKIDAAKEVSEKSDEQPMETDSTEANVEEEAKTETETETETEIEAKPETSSEENVADVKTESEVKTEDDDEKTDKPEPVYIEVDEYYVKYRNFSYLHCEWRTEEELLKGDRRVSAKIRRFQMKQAQQMNIFDSLEDEQFNPDFVETDRVLDMAEHEDPVTGKKTRNFLVKWKSLAYEDSTWELEDDVEEKKIEEYFRFNKVPPKDKWKPKRRPSPDMWRKLEKTPIYKNNNTLRPYQLEGLNWLKFSWYNSHNCILADEMGLGKTVSENIP